MAVNGVIRKPHITPYKLQNAETMVTAIRDTLTARERARWENDQNAFSPTQTGLLEGFFTIVRQLKDIMVKGGFLRTTSGL